MKAWTTVLAGTLAGALLGGCAEDPLSDLDGTPAAIVADVTLLTIGPGGSDTITASVVDGRFTPLEIPVTFTACDADFTVAVDPEYDPVPAISSRAFVTGGTTADASCVVMSGGGVSDTISGGVVPVTFAGAISSTTPTSGDTITISATPSIKFDTAAVSVRFAGNVAPSMMSKTPDQLVLLAPFAGAGPLTITGIDVTYVPDLVVTLPTAQAVTPSGDQWSGDDAKATAPDLSVPAAGQTTYALTNMTTVNNSASCPEVALGFGSSGPCMYYEFTLTEETRIDFVVDWNSAADIDIGVATAACPGGGFGSCFVDGGAGATGARPERTGAVFPAGTYYLVVELYAPASPPTNIYVTMSTP